MSSMIRCAVHNLDENERRDKLEMCNALSSSYEKYMYELHKIGVNVNQGIKKLHQLSAITPQSFSLHNDLLSMMQLVSQQILDDEIRQKTIIKKFLKSLSSNDS